MIARFAGLILLAAIAATAEAQREKLNFNPNWLVIVGDPAGAEATAFNDAAWKHVSLPYAWNEDSAYKVSIHDLPTGVAWYRKHFIAPTGARVLIEFEGIRQAGAVYLNGNFVGLHEDGVMAFGYDLTKLLKPGDNVIAVRTDNSWTYKEKATGTTFQWNNTNFYANYGGISKNVWLHVMDPVHQTLPLYSGLGTTGQYVWADRFDIAGHQARVHVETQVKNDSAESAPVRLSVEVRETNGHVLAHFAGESALIEPGQMTTLKGEAVVKGLQFWSWGYGYLYDVVTTVTRDTAHDSGGKTAAIMGHPDVATTRTGFRETEFTHGIARLNGRAIQFHGYGQRTTNEWPSIGLSVPPWMSDYSNKLMVDSGANLVRWMHVTPWKQDVESTDRVGLPVSMPAGDAEGDPKGRQWELRLQLMRDAMIYNRNNPSILFYESGNHGVSEDHMAQMKALRDEWDPHGGRASGSREEQGSKIAEYGGEMLYIDKSATKPVWAHEYMRDEGARKFWDDLTPPNHKDAADYNRDQDSYVAEVVKRWYDYYAARPGSGTRVTDGGVNIIFSDSNTHYRGDNNYRRSGEVDAMRIRKDGWFAHQAMWTGWVDVEKPMLHVDGHWNYAPGVVKTITAVSSAEKVELFLNGRSLGMGVQSSRFLFTWAGVKWEAGTLKAVGFDTAGKPVCSGVLHTAGAPVALRLTQMTAPGGLKADGADLAMFQVEVVDANGERVPTALNMVSFALDGPAEWRGGIAQGSSVPVARYVDPPDAKGQPAANPTPLLHEDNYILAKSLPVEGGVNRVLVRAGTSPGRIIVTASSEGLKAASATVDSRAFTVKGGVANELPATGLPVNLERGPTPAGASYTDWRRAVAVSTVTAGSDAEDAGKSFDDDESTAWVSKGELKDAWIEYQFANPTEAGEVELKLNSFRTRRYPIKIELDGKTVWEGLTPNSLGYCNLRFAPAVGSRLRISLTGPPVTAGQVGAEVSGKVDAGGIAGAGTGLNLIEVEIYGKRVGNLQ